MRKVSEVVKLLFSIASHPTDRLGFYRQYCMETLSKVGIDEKSSVASQFLAKCDLIFSKYGGIGVRYAPEMERVVPYYMATRSPMVSWKNLKEENYRKLRTACSMAGRAITAGFCLGRKIVMVDIDVDLGSRKMEIIDAFSSLGLPIKVTYHGGLHVYIPARTELGLVIDIDGKTILTVAPPLQLPNGKIEVKIDAVTQHPLQSYLWDELDSGNPTSVTIRTCAIPNKGPSLNWFVYGKPLSRDVEEVDQILTQVLDVVSKMLNVEVERKFKIREAQLRELSEAVSVKDNFRLGEGRKSGQSSLGKGMIAVLRPDIDFEKYIQFLQELKIREIHFKCLHFFTFYEGDEPPDPHMLSIVGWYLAQNLKIWRRSEVAHRYGVFRAEMYFRRYRRKMTVNMLYYDYYAVPYVMPDGEVIYLRPRYVPQLTQAWQLLHKSGYCEDCPYRRVCGLAERGSRGLNTAINKLVLNIVYGFHELIHYIDPIVLNRCLSGRKPLPLP